MLRSSHLTTASITAILSAASASFAGSPTVIALSGTAAAGSAGGANYLAFANPVISPNGQVAFNASLTSLAAGAPTSGIFTGTSGAVAAIALQGAAAPNGEFYGALYSSATTVSVNLNGSGQFAFQAPLTGGTPSSGIFTGTSAANLQAVALQSTAAPSGGNYLAFAAPGTNTATSPAINASGTVAFASTLNGGTPSPGAGAFLGTAGSLQTVALLGQSAPSSGVYTTAVLAPVLNGNGQVAFISLLGTSQGIFAGSPGSLQQAMLGGTTAPGTGGQLYGTPTQTFSYNNAGRLAFISSLTAGTSTSGIFSGAPGTIQPVILNNTAAPGGGTYTTFSNVTVNKLGQVAFSSSISNGTAATGLFQTTTGGTVQAVALAGSTAPDGATYSGFSSGEVQNGVGQVAFVSVLSGGDVITGTNDYAIFGGTPGALVEVVRKGDQVDVDPGPGVDLRTVGGASANPFGLLLNAGGEDGKGIVLNDNGLLVYRLSFTDGTSGIFTSVVPEPATLASLVLAGIGLLRRRNPAK